MSKEDKGFFDELVEDICRDIELKGAIEATRDENGKVDKWAATGAAFGLGHTSDDDIAMLGAMLGAEGAFDEDEDIFDDDGSDYTPIPQTKPYTATNKPEEPMTILQYTVQYKDIVSENNFIIGAEIFAIVLFTILLLYGIGSHSDGSVIYFLLMVVIDASLGYAIHNACVAKERALAQLSQRYRDSQQKDFANKTGDKNA